MGTRWFVAQVGRTQWPNVRERAIQGSLVTVEPGKKRRMWFDAPDALVPTPAGEEPRRRLRAVVLGERQPDAREAVLAGLAASCDLVSIHVPKEQRKAATRRAEELGTAGDVPEHVSEAIKATQNAAAGATLSAQGH